MTRVQLNWLFGAAMFPIFAMTSNIAVAAPTYMSGHIIDVTFAGEDVLIRLDTGLPDNCVGTSFGWMRIPPEYKPLSAFVIGLWMRGDEQQTQVTVYTDGLVGSYCRISQIDPAN
jgi:hypothetical protein